MKAHLEKTIKAIEACYASIISASSRNYVEVDIGKTAEKLGFADVGKQFRKVQAVVPVKEAQRGMKVRIDGRSFVNYGQLDSGVALPMYVVKDSSLAYKTYIPNDSMILNFT